jgi:hypothetical protein
MGHLYGALKMIKFMAKDPQLRDMVMDCDQRIIDNFMVVERFVESPELEILECFRNMAAFHYDRELPIETLNKIKDELPYHPFACSLGDNGLDWHFELGDMVMGRMLIRDIFKQDYPKSEERRRKVEEIAMRQQEIARAFTDFAGHFIRRYSR